MKNPMKATLFGGLALMIVTAQGAVVMSETYRAL